MAPLGRILILLGALLMAAGGLLLFAGRMGLPLGRLPGDIAWRGEHVSVYVPIATCLAISILLSLLAWIVNHLRR